MPSVIFFVLTAATPFTVIAGVVTTGFAMTGLIGIPTAFLVIGALLILFAVGYVTMARHVNNAGAFYAFIARGIGRPLGVGASWIALLSYNALQIGLYGLLGYTAQGLLLDWFAIDIAWWVLALGSWAIVAFLGIQQVDLNGKVLAVLLVLEIAIIAVYSFSSVANPAGGSISFATLAPNELFGPGLGAMLILGILGFIGFEAATVFSEESKDPARTVPRATYLSVLILAVLYTFASWAMTVGTGADNIVERSRDEEITVLFNLAGEQLGVAMVNIGWALLLTSVLAAMISFHNTTARYMFSLGRERVLPAALGRTSQRSSSPVVASLTQSAIGFIVILIYGLGGLDPLVELFFFAGTAGGLGILMLITTTSVSVVWYFWKDKRGESSLRTRVAPIAASLVLFVVMYLAVSHFGELLGAEEGSPLPWLIPTIFVAAALGGIVWGLVLRATRPDVYATIGMGAKAVLSEATPDDEGTEDKVAEPAGMGGR
ncbi:APC family permease [Natronoglycomyces albus]|uniref:APC family permease n=1 Tax=Natronoglycomyces albus TaxID=2811108 RepID=UPI003CCCDBB6